MLQHHRPDGVILDVAMPGMNGIQVAHLARQVHPGLPILFVSGNADATEIEGEVSGAELVRKPFDPQVLLAVLASSVQRVSAIRSG